MPPKIRSRSAASNSSNNSSTAGSKKPQNSANNNKNTTSKPTSGKPAPPQQKQQQQQPKKATQQQKQKQQQQQGKQPSLNSNINKSKTDQQQQQSTTTTNKNSSPNEQWLQILIGSYHNAIQGYTFRLQRKLFLEKKKEELVSLNSNSSSTDRFLLKQPVIRFSGNQHTGCVHSVVSNGSSLVASSGSDERIALCSVKNHGTIAKDLGSMLPASTVRALSFVSSGGGHLICGCDDGSLAVYRTRSWDCEAVLQVHTKAMLDFVMTQNGALIITLGQDRYLAFVDLMRGNVLHRHKFAPAIAKSKPVITGTAAPRTMDENPEEEKKREEEVQQMKAQQRFGFVNQPPTQLVLSPSGKTVAVIAPYYVSFFCLRTAQLISTLEQQDPQPDNEHQSAAFVMTSSPQSSAAPSWHLVLSTECGKLLACTEPIVNENYAAEVAAAAASDKDEAEVKLCKKESSWIHVSEHPSVSEEVRAKQFAQLQQSLYQVATNRIRSIASMGDASRCEGLVTASSGGEIRCWVAEEDVKLKMLQLYECSMPLNVSGRVTCVSSSTI